MRESTVYGSWALLCMSAEPTLRLPTALVLTWADCAAKALLPLLQSLLVIRDVVQTLSKNHLHGKNMLIARQHTWAAPHAKPGQALGR